MGPLAFEKEFKKRCGEVWDDTRVLFFHYRTTTKVKYASGRRLVGVSMSRDVYTLDNWCSHFKAFLTTGQFDPYCYWKIYETDGLATTRSVEFTGEATKVPMQEKDGYWEAHSDEFKQYMSLVREQEGMSGCGFKRQEKPL